MTDGKKMNLPTGNKSFGDFESRPSGTPRRSSARFKTIDGLTVIETYTTSGDGKQLLVSLELKSQVERLADAQKQPIKRVYDKAQ